MKRPRVLETLFSGSPLRSKGDSEEEVGSSEDSIVPEKTPVAPITAAPLCVNPAYSLQLSDIEPDNDDEVWPQPHAAAASAAAATKSL